MPFVIHGLRPLKDVPPLFLGRAEELRFFHQQVLSPDEPAVHLVSVWGPAGVGTSTLLARWREDASTAPFKQWCLTAFADGRVGSPLRVMTAYAAQLRAAGTPLVAFEQLLEHVMTSAFRPFPAEQQVARVLFVRQVQSMASVKSAQGIPVIGGMYEAASHKNRNAFLQEDPALQTNNGQDFQERLAALTRAFLDDLNWLAATHTRSAPPRGQRIVLFLDEMTAASSELLTWLRSQVLPAAISTQVVLVLAGPDPLERVLSTEQPLTSLSLRPFTADETRAYLAAYGIIDPAQIAAFWQRTGGLPLALRLLAPVPLDWLTTEEDAITLGVRWIEQQGSRYRALVRYAALFSKPFCHHDLAICPMFSAQECLHWSRLLMDLPFIQRHPVTGEQTSHPLVQQRVRKSFAHGTLPAYQQALQALARHYQHRLEDLQEQHGEHALSSEAGQELVLALLTQWFWLSDEASLGQATALVVQLVQQIADLTALTHLLRTFAHASATFTLPEQGKQVAGLLLAYSEADLANPAFLDALGELLALVEKHPEFPVALQARFLSRRAAAYLIQDQPRQALEDSTQALALDPSFADAWLMQGMAFAALGLHREAITAYDQALALDPHVVFASAHLGLAYRTKRAYERAVEESSRVLSLVPDLPEAAVFYRLTYGQYDEKGRGLGNFDYRLEQHPGEVQSYLFQGMAYCALGHHEQALASFAQALALDPNNPRIYAGRGYVFLEAGNLGQAQADLARSWELDASDGAIGLLCAWVQLCREVPDAQVSAFLDTLAAQISQQSTVLLCRSIALLVRQQFEQALTLLEEVLQLHPQYAEASFWKGLACVFLRQDAQALAALEQARTAEVPLPAILFTPLRRAAAIRSDFYQEQLVTLLQDGGQH